MATAPKKAPAGKAGYTVLVGSVEAGTAKDRQVVEAGGVVYLSEGAAAPLIERGIVAAAPEAAAAPAPAPAPAPTPAPTPTPAS